MTINLFLDANILLSFYALSNADISQLTQLRGVVAKKDIRLFVNDQTENEVERNRAKKLQESFKALKENKFKCHAPVFVRSLPQFQELLEVLSQANKKHSELMQSASLLVDNRQLDADKVVSELIMSAGVSMTTDNQYSAAKKRFLLGNPPGKKKSTIGDELNWEFLLDCVPQGEDLHLVSIDRDYESSYDQKKCDEFLLKEWNRVKKSTLHFYKDLNDFFKIYVPKIKLANQAKLSALISELAGSGSFSDTHAIVAKFPEGSEFNDAQVIEIMNIKENNSQVGWIESDTDISVFYAPIIKRYEEIDKNNKA